MSNEKTVRLTVDGWSNIRFGRIEGNRIAFEVMLLACGCPTCFGRLDMVRSRMKETDVRWETQVIHIPERGDRGASIVLCVEPKEMPEKIDNYLSTLLRLRISEVAQVTAN